MRRKINPELKEYLQLFAKDYTVEGILPKVNKIFNENYTRLELQKYLVRNKIEYKYKNENMVREMGKNIPIGSEYTKPDGMVMIKTAKNKYEYKQRLIYEQYHGVKLKPNEYVIFLDGNRNNFNIDNLEKVTCKESAYIGAFKVNNDLKINDKETTKALLLMAKLTYKIQEIKR